MLPSSDELEALIARSRKVNQGLGRLGSGQNLSAQLKAEVAEVARVWLRMSTEIREAGICDGGKLDTYDAAMQNLLASNNAQPRASALRNKLKPFLESASSAVVVPLIRHAGSPKQVLARQIRAAFTEKLTAEEAAYVDEAARCVTVQAMRAAMIMLWASGIAHLHAAIEARGFNAFNQAVDSALAKKGKHPFNLVKGDAKVSSLPELQRTADAVLLVIGMDLFGYDLQVFQELFRLLGQRNDAAHPGMGTPGALDVQQFASKMSDYLFARVK